MRNSASILVFLAEDSSVALTILKRILASSAEVEVVGTAVNRAAHWSKFRPEGKHLQLNTQGQFITVNTTTPVSGHCP
jgi:hypothetical protein